MADNTATTEDRGTATPSADTAEKWNNVYQQARMARMSFERKWYTYLAFVSGKQYIQWNYESSALAVGRMIEPLNPGNRVRIVINKTRRILRKELAKINKERVRGFVSPSNTDDNSQAAARGAEQLADYITNELKLAWRFKQCDWWMLICGTAFLKTYYDESVPMGYGKQDMQLPPQAQGMGMQNGQQQQQQQQQEHVMLYGSPVVECVDPFHILVPNLDEPDLQKQEWVMHVTMKSPDWVEQRFGIKMDGVSVATNTLESRLMAIQGMTQDASKQKAVEIREIWIKPDKNHPKGARVTCTQEKVLEVLEEYPYVHGKYPFAKRTYIENSIFYGATLVEDLMPLQVEYNRTRSQIIEDKNRMGRPQLAVELGSVDVKKLRGAAGEVVEFRPGSRPPQPIEIAGLPNYIVDHVNRISVEMAELASQENTDGSSIPNGVTAATAIAYLQENQDALIMDTLRDKETAWETVLQQCLAYTGQYWDAQRMITVAGRNGGFESYLFSKSDLSGQTNWRAVVGSATPQSYSAKQAQIMELMKMGAVAVPDALEQMELGDTARLYEGMQIDKREAQKENIRMANGVFTPVQMWQEHLIHIQEHDNARKREEYESWPQQATMMIAYHTVTHMEQFLNEVGVQVSIDPMTGQPDQMFMQMRQQYMQQSQMAMQQGQLPQVPPQYEMALRSQINRLTMAPQGGVPPSQPQTTSGGPPQ